MGCIISKKQKSPSNYVRVVNVNGRVEDFYYPITAGEVAGKVPNNQLICTQSQLISGYIKPLKPDTPLEPNHVYCMLSYSTIDSESSPMDISLLAKRLVKLAKTSQPNSALLSNDAYSNVKSSGSESSSATYGNSVGKYGKGESCKRSESWKPILDTIIES